jgi:hypothetical protein
MSWLAYGFAFGILAALAAAAWHGRRLLHDSGRLAVVLVKHPDIPRPLRWLLVVAVLPIPGPFEEIAGGLAILLLLRVRPGLVARAWNEIRAGRKVHYR